MKVIFLIYILLISLILIKAYSQVNRKDEKLIIHVIPHTHDDVGWLNTAEEYYNGKGDLNISVKNILSTMVKNLKDDKNRTFVYSEIYFFRKWWEEAASDEEKNLVREFLKENRLEFVGAGYSMPDEAVTNYIDLIQNMKEGLEFIKDTFPLEQGNVNTAWSIDPFGHSKTFSFLLQKFGFKNFVLMRINSKEKEIRRQRQELEFNWKNKNNSEDSLFTHILYDDYCPPDDVFPYFYKDYELKMEEKDWEAIAHRMFSYFKTKFVPSYKTNEVMFLYGCDFSFEKNSFNYKNLDKVLSIFRSNPYFKDRIDMFYSTPHRYFSSIKNKKEYPVVSDYDFFPYWTGYYSSRAYLKGVITDSSRLLDFSSKLYLRYNDKLQAQVKESIFNSIVSLRRGLSILQHHDAVTGTEKNYVSDDYLNILRKASNSTIASLNNMFSNLDSAVAMEDYSEGYNKTSYKNSLICYEVNTDNKCKSLNLTKENNEYLLSYLFSANYLHLENEFYGFSDTTRIISFKTTTTNFRISNIPLDNSDVLEFNYEIIEHRDTDNPYEVLIFISNEYLESELIRFLIRYDKNYNNIDKICNETSLGSYSNTNINKLLSSIINKDNLDNNDIKEEIEVDIKNGYYESFDIKKRNSHIRYFTNSEPSQYSMGVNSTIIQEEAESCESRIHQGKIFTKIMSYCNNINKEYLYINNIARNKYFSNRIYFTITVKPINIDYDNDPGKEILFSLNIPSFSNINEDVKNNDGFYLNLNTDSNGLQDISRVTNFNKYYDNIEVTEVVEDNVFPITKYAYYKDTKSKSLLRIYTSKPCGASTNNDGTINILFERYNKNGLDGYFNDTDTTGKAYSHFFALDIELNSDRNLIQNKIKQVKFLQENDYYNDIFNKTQVLSSSLSLRKTFSYDNINLIEGLFHRSIFLKSINVFEIFYFCYKTNNLNKQCYLENNSEDNEDNKENIRRYIIDEGDFVAFKIEFK